MSGAPSEAALLSEARSYLSKPPGEARDTDTEAALERLERLPLATFPAGLMALDAELVKDGEDRKTLLDRLVARAVLGSDPVRKRFVKLVADRVWTLGHTPPGKLAATFEPLARSLAELLPADAAQPILTGGAVPVAVREFLAAFVRRLARALAERGRMTGSVA